MKNKSISPHYGWVVLAMGVLVVFGALGLARFGFSMLLPAMQSDLGLNNSQVGLLATVSLLGYLALAIIGGALASKYGVRMVCTLGLLLAGAGMILTGLSYSFLAVAVWCGVSGIGSGAVNVSVMGLWTAWFSKQKRGMAAGIAVSGSSVGLIFTGTTVPWMVSVYGKSAWHTSWLVFGIIALLLSAGTYLVLRNSAAEMGLSRIGEAIPDGPPAAASAGAPQLKSVYASARVWYLGIVYIAFGFSYIIYMTFFGKYLTAECGYSAVAAGKMFMLMGWGSFLCGIIWGTVSDAIGRKYTLIILFLVHSISFGLFAAGSSPLYLTISAVLFGLTAWSIPAVMAAACGDIFGPELAMPALGFITLFFGGGQALGPIAAGVIADAMGSFAPVFLLASAVAFMGAVGTALLVLQESISGIPSPQHKKG